jgi:hypothetical protein
MAHKPKKGLPFSMVLPVDLTPQLLARISNFDESIKSRYLKEVVMSKFVSRDTDPASVRRERAIAKWLATEKRNAETNERILATHEEYHILPHVPFATFVGWCRGFIRDRIGEVPPLEALFGSFSGGASTSRKRTRSHPAFKYTGKAHITSPCLDLYDILRDELCQWLSPLVEIPGPMKPVQDWMVDGVCRPAKHGPFKGPSRLLTAGIPPLETEVVSGNVLFTVPKKTDIDRVACKEPDINMFIQWPR